MIEPAIDTITVEPFSNVELRLAAGTIRRLLEEVADSGNTRHGVLGLAECQTCAKIAGTLEALSKHPMNEEITQIWEN